MPYFNPGLLLAVLAALPALALPSPDLSQDSPGPSLEKRAGPVLVRLTSGTLITGRTASNIDNFNAIPYADPPVGPLRLKPPRRFSGVSRSIDATRDKAPACPQMSISSQVRDYIRGIAPPTLQAPFFDSTTEGQEDCLTINIQRPQGTKAGDKLPVLFWIYGGGFQVGSTAAYDASNLMAAAIAQQQPFIFVAVNYRLGGFGFLPGREILNDGSSNLGLLDQRLGLEWVADNIEQFGGDSTKVTLWGHSAGAISVLDQMLLYGGNASYNGRPLFHGAIMNSGSIIPAKPVDSSKAQAVYDQVVRDTGCDALDDTLACLRQLPYRSFRDAVNSFPSLFSYNSLFIPYLPRPDGLALPDSPDRMLDLGNFHTVPMIIGTQEDEGTIFSLFQKNVTTAEDAAAYLSDLFFEDASRDSLRELAELYQPSVAGGSPFRTGVFNELYFGYKRLAALLGDLTFSMARRITLDLVAASQPSVPTWSYMASYEYGTPIVGTFHGTDMLHVFKGIPPIANAVRSCRTYYFNFIYYQDPNRGVGGFINWPRWTDGGDLLWFQTPYQNAILKDDFRPAVGRWIFDNREQLYV